MMVQVYVLAGFNHGNKSYKRKDTPHFSEPVAKQLIARRLVTPLQDAPRNPKKAGGTKSSASPAVPASPKQTSSASKRGGSTKRRKKKASDAASS